MDVKVAFVVVCLCALALTSTEAAIPKCCIKTRNSISNSIIKRVYKVEHQSAKGACDIDALVLYIKDKATPICLNPKWASKWRKQVEEWRKMDKRKA